MTMFERIKAYRVKWVLYKTGKKALKHAKRRVQATRMVSSLPPMSKEEIEYLSQFQDDGGDDYI